MYLLSIIDGEVIEQTFNMSRLKQGLLRLPNGKSVRNISNYKLEMIRLRHRDVVQPETCVPDSSQTLVKTVLYTHKNDLSHISHDTDTSHIWCQSPTFSRHQLQPVKLIYYIFIMHMPAGQLSQTLIYCFLTT